MKLVIYSPRVGYKEGADGFWDGRFQPGAGSSVLVRESGVGADGWEIGISEPLGAGICPGGTEPMIGTVPIVMGIRTCSVLCTPEGTAST